MEDSGNRRENKRRGEIYREKLRQQNTGIEREEIKCEGKKKDQENIGIEKMKKIDGEKIHKK
jgi:hypothetical protein